MAGLYPTILFCAHVDHRSLMEELVDYGQAHEMFEGYTSASGFGPGAISGLIRTERPVCIVFDASLDLQFVKDTAAAIRAKAEMPRTVLIVLLAHGRVAIDPTLFDASFVQTEMDTNYLLKLVFELIEQQKPKSPTE